jgi:HSP20 family protein
MIVRRRFTAPSWGWRNPFEELEDMRNWMEGMARNLGGQRLRRSAGVFPLMNLTEDKENYHIRAELPGLKADDLDISITGSRLAISGERKIAQEDESAKYHRREREPGKFSRMIELPDYVDSEKADAKMENGVLIIVLPKAASAKPRQITVS